MKRVLVRISPLPPVYHGPRLDVGEGNKAATLINFDLFTGVEIQLEETYTSQK